jgi:hypothetical protein
MAPMSEPPEAPINSVEAEREVNEIASVATRLGVQLDRRKALEWIMAVSEAERETAFAQDAQTGIFGHRISLMDFDTSELEHFRRLASMVRLARRAGVESAIAIAGSSAQGKVQLFPGDVDFFERINIKAASEAAARQALRELMRETALRAFTEPDIVLIEVNFGTYPTRVLERGVPRAAGDSISWTPADVLKGSIQVQTAEGAPLEITWDEAHSGLGWSYLGWIVADRVAGRMALASNMLDVTWEAPDGSIIALDGSLDPFFQEIYLEPAAVAVFSKVIQYAASNAMSSYVSAMRWQAFHYTHQELNYGKAAKRLYNLFRLTDQLEAAAYVRELFDEPGAQLYQVPGLLEAVNIARDVQSGIDRETVISQIDRVIRAVVEAASGVTGADIVMELIRMRDQVIGRAQDGTQWDVALADARAKCAGLINEFFRVRLFGLPQIEMFVAALKDES